MDMDTDNTKKLNKLINKLPIELFYHVLSYSYKYPPSSIRDDIISYIESRNIIRNIFYCKYLSLFTIEKKADIKHLVFHLHCYNTGLSNIYDGYEPKILELCNRNYMYSKNQNYNIQNLINIAYPVQNHELRFGTVWGLLTPEERNQFIYIHQKKHT